MTSKRHTMPSGTSVIVEHWGGSNRRATTFSDAAPADLLVIAVAGALERSFGVGAVMRTRVKLQTLINLWKNKK